jgi:NAD(P)H-nitrite reductase large subunit
MQYSIIGSGPAGLRAAETIRKFDPKGEILLFSSEKEPPYARHLLPEFISGIKKKSHLTFHPPSFYRKNQLELRMDEAVEEIDANKGSIRTTGGTYRFDRLLLSIGGRPSLPRRSLLKIKGVFVLRTLADAYAILAYLRKEKVREAAVVGGGIVGLKVAYMLNQRGIRVAIVEQESRLLPHVLDPDSLVPVSKLCWRNGIKILLDERFREFTTSGKQKKVDHLVTYSGQSIPCRMAILCPGMSPNIELPQSIGIKVRKGIVADKRMRTSIENIYAAGDIVETRNVATRGSEVMPLWPNAFEQGQIAGANMAGEHMTYQGAIWKNRLSVFGLDVVTLGQSHRAEKIRGAKILTSPKLKQGYGVRLVFSGLKLVGATLVGKVGDPEIYEKIIRERQSVWNSREELMFEGTLA